MEMATYLVSAVLVEVAGFERCQSARQKCTSTAHFPLYLRGPEMERYTLVTIGTR
jgi:hypothetical protein